MALKDNILTPEVKATATARVDNDRLAKSIDQIAITYEFKNGKPKPPTRSTPRSCRRRPTARRTDARFNQGRPCPRSSRLMGEPCATAAPIATPRLKDCRSPSSTGSSPRWSALPAAGVHLDEARNGLAVSVQGSARSRAMSSASRSRSPAWLSRRRPCCRGAPRWKTCCAAEIVEPHRSDIRRRRVEYVARAQNLLASVGLGGQGDKYPWELSGGMQQRTSLCRALIHEPRAPDARRAVWRTRCVHPRGIVVRDPRPACRAQDHRLPRDP